MYDVLLCLSEQQTLLLEAIKNEWDRDQSRWNDAFREAERYKEQFGNVGIPPKYQTEHGFSLGSWLNAQRIRYKAGKQADDRVQHSNDVIPVNCITDSGYHLGQWVLRQRKNHAAGKLEKAKANRLRELGVIE